MKLTLAVNIGTVDNANLKLESTTEGDTVEVDSAVADYLLKRGWATVHKPEALKADPPAPEVQTAGFAAPPKGKANG